MKKIFMFIIIICFALLGCSQMDAVKGEFDLKGKILEINEDRSSILIDAEEDGLVWITLNERDVTSNYEVGQEIVVWIDGGLAESYPAQAKALNIESVTPDN